MFWTPADHPISSTDAAGVLDLLARRGADLVHLDAQVARRLALGEQLHAACAVLRQAAPLEVGRVDLAAVAVARASAPTFTIR